ncbi:MAG: hypothetical protein VXZ38_00055 [Planctomycetota bacterium]|nr:hypothetical protein [Planctomycetota bacterium]
MIMPSLESADPVVLELRDLSHQPTFENGLQFRNVDLEIRSGELLTIQVDGAARTRSFASMLQGIGLPDSGEIFFMNQDWLGSDYQRHFSQRSLIGRVFDGQAWLENLNVDENVTLAMRHHGGTREEIRASLHYWMNHLGLDKLVSRRPAFVAPATLQLHQWIRAFIGKPKLVILERPLQFLSEDWFAKLLSAVEVILNNDIAVLWLDSRTDLQSLTLNGRSNHVILNGGKFTIPLDTLGGHHE